MDAELIERARLLGIEVIVEDGVIDVESVHLSGTYPDSEQGRTALEEDLNKVVGLLQQ